MVKHLVEDEEMNLQDLIFILLFFFIIAQTLIVFKMQKDIPIPPQTDDRVKQEKDEEEQLITLFIDYKSNVYTSIKMHGRTDVVKGLESSDPKEIEQYMNPFKGSADYLPSEKAKSNEKIYEKLVEIKKEVGYDKPRLGLFADHRARYGVIFQVNQAITKLIKDGEIDDKVKWKVQEVHGGLEKLAEYKN